MECELSCLNFRQDYSTIDYSTEVDKCINREIAESGHYDITNFWTEIIHLIRLKSGRPFVIHWFRTCAVVGDFHPAMATLRQFDCDDNITDDDYNSLLGKIISNNIKFEIFSGNVNSIIDHGGKYLDYFMEKVGWETFIPHLIMTLDEKLFRKIRKIVNMDAIMISICDVEIEELVSGCTIGQVVNAVEKIKSWDHLCRNFTTEADTS